MDGNTPQEVTMADSAHLIRENFHDMAERLAYSLHFHSISHFLSADRYSIRDRWLTYLSIAMAAVCTLNAGSVLNDYMNSTNNTNITLALLSAVSSVILSSLVVLNSSEHSPKSLKEQHSKAGSKLKELEQKVDVWGRTTAMDPDQSTEQLRMKYNDFLSDMTKVKEDYIKSEDWTFPTVHQQLGKKWKAVKEKDQIKKEQ
ncbi:uncharacterized protein LOC144447446 [Glandiceps talaboti]